MRRLSTALQHPPVRLAASWVGGLLVFTVLFWHLTTCARTGCQTLSGLSWFVESSIAFGRIVDRLFTAYGWYVVAAIVSLVISSFLVMNRGRTRRSMIAELQQGLEVVRSRQ